MPDLATLPTRRDEAWRYADIDAAGRLGLDAINAWEEITLGAGETLRPEIVGDFGIVAAAKSWAVMLPNCCACG